MFLITTAAHFQAFHSWALRQLRFSHDFRCWGFGGKKYLQWDQEMWELFIKCLGLKYWITSPAFDRLPYPLCLSNTHISFREIFASCVWKEKLQIYLLPYMKCTRIYCTKRERENKSEKGGKKRKKTNFSICNLLITYRLKNTCETNFIVNLAMPQIQLCIGQGTCWPHFR